MRVLHVIQSLIPQANAPVIALGGLWSALRKDGIDSEVLTTESLRDADPAFHLFDRREVTTQLYGVDLVHIHGWRFEAARAVAVAARRMGIPYVISSLGELSASHANGNGWKQRLRGWLGENALIRGAAWVIVTNQAEADELGHRAVHPRIEILPLGLCFDEYVARLAGTNDAKPIFSDPGGKIVLVLAPIEPRFGGVTLLKALAELGTDADGWKVVFAGAQVGEWRKMIEAAIRRKGGADRVHFAEASDVATQLAWLERASLLAGCHLAAAPGVSVIQALACGVPVMATRFAVPDELQDAVQLTEPNRAAIRESLRILLRRNESESRAATQTARLRAASVLDWSTLVEGYRAVYERVLGATEKRRKAGALSASA